MPPVRTPATGSADDGSASDASAGALFTIVWEALADVLGTGAVAAIVRRAVGRAVAQSPELKELIIIREDLEYRYTLPQLWWQKAERAPGALRVLVAELGRLLVELTGTVVIRRLEQIPELRARGLVWRAEEAN
jgi:hypothetical protein